MPRPKTISSLAQQLDGIINNASAAIASAVLATIEAEVRNAVAARGGAAPAPVSAPRVTKAPRKSGKRTSEQVAKDDAKLLAFVTKNPGLRSEDVVAKVGMPKQDVASGLLRLREAGKVSMKGQKRAARYTAK